MQIAQIEMSAFGVHDACTITLPPTGIVLVRGTNGSGKSTMLEAVSTAVWGKPLRGAPMWQAAHAGSVRVTLADGWAIERKRSAKGSMAVTEVANGAETRFQTAAEADRAMDARQGTLQTWTRTHVFSSADADKFSSATDADRKRLLEDLLGLSRLDAAHALARDEARTAERALSAIVATIAQGEARLSGLVAGAEIAQQALDAALPDAVDVDALDGLNAKLAALRDASAALADEIKGLRAAETDAARRGATANAEARIAADRAAKLAAMGACPTCGQTVPDALKESAGKIAAKARAAADVVLREADAAADAAQASLSDLSADKLSTDNAAAEARARVQGLAAREARHAQAVAAQARLQGQIDAYNDHAASLSVEIERQRAEVAAATLARDIAASVADVLGTRGVRAYLSTMMLAAVQYTSNEWLAKLSDGRLQLTLSATRELKGGGHQDAIALEVSGAGGGNGYKGMSGGERRRVDLALLLGLAQVAGGDVMGGTIFLDECADALDVEGTVAMVGVLNELARDRAVVVITHSDALASRLRPVQTLLFG